MLTSAGSLRRSWREFAVTRWREDATSDSSGAYIYVRDTVGGKVWSVGVQPTGAEPDDYEVAFSEDRATFARRDGSLTTTVEILVASDEDADVQLVTLYNSGDETRVIELTSYAELALAPQATDLVHPAFAKLFVQTEHVAEPSGGGALIATRRRRTETEPEIWAAHLAVAEGPVQHETDRARFIGRGRGVRSPAALRGSAPLSGSTGTVLDAVFALRCRVTVPPGGAARVAFWTLVAGSRAALLDCIDKHRDAAAFDRASTLAWARAQVLLRHIGISPRQADLFQDLAGHLLFPGTALRAGGASIMAGAGPQSGLWSRAISGDLPILLLRISDGADVDIAAQLILAHEYFRLKQFYIDLVILDDHPSSYAQDLQASLEGLIRAGSRPGTGQGAIFLLRSDMIPPATTALLIATARVVLTGSRGTLSEQLASPKPPQSLARVPAAARPPPVIVPGRPALPPLEFQNGYGGFTDNAAIYVIVLGPGRCTPAPWINVIANESFGFLVSAEGCGYSWSGNSRENQLTPWSNDPVTDDAGEAVFMQEGKALWSATAGVRRDVAATYVTRHGKGFSRFDRVVNDIESSLLTYVPLDAPLKISRLTLRNGSGRRRSIAITFYAAWVLGPARSTTAAFVTTEMDGETGAMFARNRWGTAPHDRVAFADLGGRQSDWSGDRRAFIGRNGSLNDPAALATLAPLPGGVGAGLDPCCAMRTLVEIPENGSLELVFFLGEAPTAEEASRLIKLYREKDLDQVLADIHRHWQDVLCAVQVKTPDRAMDIMLNGWLVYQTLASRIQARAGFYQASGAYGFRDQLQDGMALTAACPGLVRRHLLRAAAVQFTEGDVLHWWLPESGRGVRTRISDDCAWLAYTVAHYVTATGDTGVLDEKIGYLSAPGLAVAEADRFFLPAAAAQDGTLYEHCARALDHSLALGGHGLPLIGTGDWNDGMNRIGSAGRGESVWLGWFLHDALEKLATVAEARHDYDHAGSWRAHATALSDALEAAWDGDRYVRAYFDDGTPLGGQGGAAAGIDAIAQSWAVISAAGQPERAACAMASVTRDLVKDGLLLVLAPPFDSEGPDPGYIRGYPPGVRENGGQYTHAAMWTVLAETMLGHGAEAARMFAMLNPINHAVTERAAEKYKLEPYVLAADIYSVAPHVGRGGWSWYTGSAGWMQRVGIENILGVKIRGDTLLIDPCISPGWAEYEVNIRWQSARYVITVKNPAHVCRGVKTISCDGVELPAPDAIRMLDDGASHDVRVLLG
jgi:cyclic beta-1,2-glucan synthetase